MPVKYSTHSTSFTGNKILSNEHKKETIAKQLWRPVVPSCSSGEKGRWKRKREKKKKKKKKERKEKKKEYENKTSVNNRIVSEDLDISLGIA